MIHYITLNYIELRCMPYQLTKGTQNGHAVLGEWPAIFRASSMQHHAVVQQRVTCMLQQQWCSAIVVVT
jgi:hypothetical protein